jgi:hypothetical protein
MRCATPQPRIPVRFGIRVRRRPTLLLPRVSTFAKHVASSP